MTTPSRLSTWSRTASRSSGATTNYSDGFALDPDALQHVLKVIFEDEDDFERKCRAYLRGSTRTK